MAAQLYVNDWMEPSLDTPGVRYGHANRFPVGVIDSNKARKWYRYRDSSHPFQVLSELGRIENLQQRSFQMLRKHVSYTFFKEAHAKQSTFTLRVGYLLNATRGSEQSLIRKLAVIYSQSALASYEVDAGFEEGRITFEESAEVTYVPYKPKTN